MHEIQNLKADHTRYIIPCPDTSSMLKNTLKFKISNQEVVLEFIFMKLCPFKTLTIFKEILEFSGDVRN